MGRASDQIFVFKALTSSIGLLASGLLLQGLSSAIGLFDSDLLLQGFHLRDRVIRFKPSSARISPPRSGYSVQTFFCKALSSEIGLFDSDLLLQGFHLREWKPLFGIIFSFKALSSTLGSSLKTFFCKALTASKPASESRLTNTGVSPCEVFLFIVYYFATNISQHLQENHTRSPSGRRYLRFFKFFPNL